MKKIVFTCLYPMWSYHYISELNLVQMHINNGNEVFIVECDESLMACECNKNHDIITCLQCIGVRNDGVSLLSSQVQKISFDKSEKYVSKAKKMLGNVNTLDDLKKLRYKEFDIGSAVFSSLVDHTLNTRPSICDNKNRILKLLADALNVFENFNGWLKINRPDEVYIFNGRYAVARAFVRSCQINKTAFSTHEKSGDLKKIFVFKNALSHDPTMYPKMVNDLWHKRHEDNQFISEGIEFFEERPKGKLTGWHSFVEKQNKDQLPLGFDSTRRNIAIFGSSESELLAVEGLVNGFNFPEQLSIYKSFLSISFKINPELKYYLRLHPNSQNEKNLWWEDEQLKLLPNLSIIPPDSKVSSYSLLYLCEKTIGLTSSMCLEATYWGKPSIVLGPTYYSGIDAVYEPSTLEEACRLVSDPELSPKPKENAIKFGAFWRCFGDELPYSEPHNYYTLDFKGKILGEQVHIHKWLIEYANKNNIHGFQKWLIWKLMLSKNIKHLNAFLYTLQRLQGDIMWWSKNWRSRLKHYSF